MTASIDRQSTIDKWRSIIGSIDHVDRNHYPPFDGLTSSNIDLILPIAIRVSTKTIGLDLVSVMPMGSPFDSSEISNEIKAINRERKIESIIEDKEYVEMVKESHPNYKSGLFYMDFTYNATASSQKIV